MTEHGDAPEDGGAWDHPRVVKAHPETPDCPTSGQCEVSVANEDLCCEFAEKCDGSVHNQDYGFNCNGPLIGDAYCAAGRCAEADRETCCNALCSTYNCGADPEGLVLCKDVRYC